LPGGAPAFRLIHMPEKHWVAHQPGARYPLR
jgi:hypothetical protein